MNPLTTLLLAGLPFEFNPNQWFILVLVVIACLMAGTLGLANIIASTIHTIHRRRIEENLKQDMLDRGMSAEEIVMVIEAASPPEDAIDRLVLKSGKK